MVAKWLRVVIVLGLAAASPASGRSLAVTSDGTVFALLDEQLHRSKDNGASWERGANPAGFNHIVSFIAASDGKLYGISLTSERHTLSRSTDQGRSWTTCPFAFPEDDSGSELVATADGLYLASGRGLARSTDHCMSWKPLDRKRANYVTAAADGTLYALMPGDVIFVSHDRGARWKRVPHKPFAKDLDLDRIYVLPGGTQLLTAPRELLRSTDRGTTWPSRPGETALPNTRSILAAADAVYVGAGDRVYRSTDQGMSWTPFGQGVGKCRSVDYLAQAPGGAMFALCYDAVFRSTDRGATWQNVLQPPPRRQR
jgi:photosystem II stability/assembly factor-like uncharacterized protein